MRRGTLAVALAAALALLSACGDAGDDAPDEPRGPRAFYGVVSAELPDASELERLSDAGVGTLRESFAWGSVQVAPGAAYDWSHYDQLVGAAAERDVRVLATVYSSPVWAEPSPEHPPLGESLAGFVAFARAAAERYGTDGEFWRENPGLPELPVTDWQLWNEPNSPLFWKPKPSVADYLTLLRSFSDAVKGADERARVVLGGLSPTPGPGVDQPFLRGLLRGGAGELADVVAVHPYAASPPDALQKLRETRAFLDGAGEATTPIWATEIGWASAGAPSELTVGPERQASYLSAVFELAAAEREPLRLNGLVWYSLGDLPGDDWFANSGLLTLEGEPKPAWAALAGVAGGEP
jgi:polysaccharide biosynthesis protein PslG